MSDGVYARGLAVTAEPYPVRLIEKLMVIRTETLWGKGVQDDPMRVVTQYWTLDGEEVFKIDPCDKRDAE